MIKTNRSNKCQCAPQQKIMCKNCSRLKMVILLKTGNQHLKVSNGTKNINPVWYSHISKNRKPLDVIAKAMVRRLKDTAAYTNAVNLVIFYTLEDGQEYTRIKL